MSNTGSSNRPSCCARARPRRSPARSSLVTGAASGIGRATAGAFRSVGAAVVGLDIAPEIDELTDGQSLGIRCDITDDGAVEHALEAAVRTFGGLDVVVCNAGVFPQSTRIDELSTDDWRRVMRVNVDANLALLRTAAPLLERAPRGGPRRRQRFEERARARSGGGGLLGVEGCAHAARARRGARVGVVGHPGEHRPPERGLRHRRMGRRTRLRHAPRATG